MTLTEKTLLTDIFDLPVFEPMRGQWIASHTDWFSGGKKQITVRQLGDMQPTWGVADMLFGIARLQSIAEAGQPYVFPVETGNPARLIYLPANRKETDLFCLLLAGGGYGAVCTMGESLPVAARLNELGMDCFCLNYRTATPDSMIHGLMPKPLDDIASALRYIRNHFTDAPYLMTGFSAGGNACALWGTAHLGSRAYSLEKPRGLLLGYPLISLLNMPSSPVKDYFMQGLFGTGHNLTVAEEYSAHLHVDPEYPPVYLIRAQDDVTVPARDTELFDGAMTKAHVRHVVEVISAGGHGFGLGSGTPAEGWVDRALTWISHML